MRIEISMATVPPTITLQEPDDFSAFAVAVPCVEHVWVAPEQVIALAGRHGDDPAWREAFDSMLTYAGGRGWVRDDGAIRAHVDQTT